MKTRAPTPPDARQLGAAVLDAHPIPTLVVDRAFRIVHANLAARRLLSAREGASVADVLPCTEPHAPDARGSCPGHAFHGAVDRALAGESVRERGFVLRTGANGEAADLHLIAFAAPVDWGGGRHAILAVADVDAMLADPRVVRLCAGCGRIQDEEGQWHTLHRYLGDRLGLEIDGPLCTACAGGGADGR